MQKLSLSDSLSGLFENAKVKKFTEKLKKDKKALFIIIIGVTGMLMIMLSPSGETVNSYETAAKDITYDCDYIQLEVTKLVESIKGAGKVKILITYESTQESVYAVNSEEKNDGTEIHIKNDYIITDNDTGLILKVLYPKVRGVAVICQGGNDPVVKEKIYSVISSLFDITANKISVADMA